MKRRIFFRQKALLLGSFVLPGSDVVLAATNPDQYSNSIAVLARNALVCAGELAAAGARGRTTTGKTRIGVGVGFVGMIVNVRMV